MVDGCDGLRGPEKWICRLNKVITKVGDIFGFNVFIQSSENHIGTVSGDSDPIRVKIHNTVDTYNGTSAPVVIGGIVEIPNAMRINGGTGVLSRAGLINRGNEQISAYISFYSDEPTGNYENKQTPTNNGDDLDNLHLGTLQANSSDWKLDGVGGTVGIPGENMVLKSAENSKSLYAVVKIVGMSSTLANADTLTLLLNILRD